MAGGLEQGVGAWGGCLRPWGMGGWLESGGDRMDVMDVCLDVLTDGWKEISPVFWVRCPKGNSLG